MEIDARKLVDFVADNIEFLRLVVSLTDSKMLGDLVDAVERVSDTEAEREQLAAYLRWIPGVSGVGGQPQEAPPLPIRLEDCRRSLDIVKIHLHVGR